MASDPFAASKRSQRLRTIILSAIAVSLVALCFYLYTRSQRSSLLIQGPTTGIAVTLNGTKVTGKATNQGLEVLLLAGRYKLQITRENYLPFAQDITIVKGQASRVRPVFILMPVTKDQQASGGVSFLRVIPENSMVFYLGDGGTRLYRFNTTDSGYSSIPVSEKSLSRITNVEWPITGNVALITRSEGTYLLEIPKYDFQNQRFDKVAGSEVISPAWDPTSTRIAAAYFLPNGEQSLILANERFSNITRLTSLTGFTNPKVVWSPDSRFLAVVNRSADTTQNNVWVYTLSDGSFNPVTSTGNVSDVSFSPDERRLLIGRADNTLAVRTLDTGEEVTLQVTGIVERSVWHSNESLYLPGTTQGSLVDITTTGSTKALPFTLPGTNAITSLRYFSKNQTLVFATNESVYTVSLGE